MVYALLVSREWFRRRRRSASAAPAGRRRRSELVAFRRGAAPADNLGWLPAQLGSKLGFAPASRAEVKAGCTKALQRAHSDAYRSHRGHENGLGCGGCVLACL